MESVWIRFKSSNMYKRWTDSPPEDAKDICFVLCALNGHGTHIVTYDRHLLDLADEYSQRFFISVLEPVPFLKELREFLNE